jgi:hypothetical protein
MGRRTNLCYSSVPIRARLDVRELIVPAPPALLRAAQPELTPRQRVDRFKQRTEFMKKLVVFVPERA